MTKPTRTLAGRPEVTSYAAIEQAAFRLFAERGFEGTTLDDIADAVGVGRRTLFRYYASKNDIPWGQFDRTLEGFRKILDDMPEDIPLHVAVHRAVVAFNEFPEDAIPPHRERMRLILETPALQAHSVLRYAEWRAVIAEYVARRSNLEPNDILPSVVAHVSLAIALTAYDQWLRRPGSSIGDLLGQAMTALAQHIDMQTGLGRG
jgi:TetR/AcrR family transcriptional regulator, regulator of mycofactocin system